MDNMKKTTVCNSDRCVHLACTLMKIPEDIHQEQLTNAKQSKLACYTDRSPSCAHTVTSPSQGWALPVGKPVQAVRSAFAPSVHSRQPELHQLEMHANLQF